MIWCDWMLRKGCTNYDLVSPFDIECINPASIDLRIARDTIVLRRTLWSWILYYVRPRRYADQIVLRPGDAILASTVEIVKIPTTAAAVVYLKSSMARRGLDHALAGWIDPGFHGTITLELHAHRKIVLDANQRVIQLVLMEMSEEPEKPYQGRYQYQMGPTEAR